MTDLELLLIILGVIFGLVILFILMFYWDNIIHRKINCSNCEHPYNWHYAYYDTFGILISQGCHAVENKIEIGHSPKGTYKRWAEDRCECVWDRPTILLNLPENE